jgi:hypothetical protein
MVYLKFDCLNHQSYHKNCLSNERKIFVRGNISFLITILPSYSSRKENTDMFFFYILNIVFLMLVCPIRCHLSIYLYSVLLWCFVLFQTLQIRRHHPLIYYSSRVIIFFYINNVFPSSPSSSFS